MPSTILIISAVHDYRMKRRGSIQALAQAFRDSGAAVTFLSLRFSWLSRLKRDPRDAEALEANRLVRENGIDCFLWRTPLHPFGTHVGWLDALLTPLFRLYALWPSRAVDELIRRSDRIVIESGLGVMLIGRIRRLNPAAAVIYRASDRLTAIGQHPAIARALRRNQKMFDHFALLGPGMADDFCWAYPKAFVVPAGHNPSYFREDLVSPYSAPVNALSLGPMLFDPGFFETAGPLFPDVRFHIFGVPAPRSRPPANVVYHAEIAHRETAAYVRHATVGVAPYKSDRDIGYLADTSSKLQQYAAFGIPAVCPSAVVGSHPSRFGYTPDDPRSIHAALSQALAAPRRVGLLPKTWPDIIARLIRPSDFDDTRLRGRDPDMSASLMSLVVATRGRREQLARLLSSLKMQTSRSFQVIIVDQNDRGYLDDLIGIFASDLKIVWLSSQPGLSRARNLGLAAVGGSLVAFPDDDCWYPATLVDDVLRFFSVYPNLDLMMGQTVDESGRASLNPPRRSGGPITPRNVWFSGNSNTLFLRSSVAQTHRFDESLGVGASSPYQSGEETDFVLQCIRDGSRAVHCPDVKVFHDQVDQDIGREQLRRAWTYAAGFGRVLRKRYSPAYSAYRICRTFVSAVVAALLGKPRMAAYKITWCAGTFRGWLF